MSQLEKSRAGGVDQILLREDAAAANPEFATLEGRAMQDVRDTIGYLALGLKPRTVLGGLMASMYSGFDSALLEENDKSAVDVAVAGNIDSVGPNQRGDRVVDLLEGLVELGFAERAFVPNSIDAVLLPDSDHRKIMNQPTYRLNRSNLPSPVTAVIDQITTFNQEQREWEARPRHRFWRRSRES
jgi:hypothetical protein